MLYVASSWRNKTLDAVFAVLTAAGIEHYNFKEPGAGRNGFAWQEVMPSFDYVWQQCPKDEYIAALEHPRAVEGFTSDFDAMKSADRFVLVLPCGKSAHLELGWAIGQGLPTAILLEHRPMLQPELMYKMVDHIAPSVFDLLGWLGVKD